MIETIRIEFLNLKLLETELVLLLQIYNVACVASGACINWNVVGSLVKTYFKYGEGILVELTILILFFKDSIFERIRYFEQS